MRVISTDQLDRGILSMYRYDANTFLSSYVPPEPVEEKEEEDFETFLIQRISFGKPMKKGQRHA